MRRIALVIGILLSIILVNALVVTQSLEPSAITTGAEFNVFGSIEYDNSTPAAKIPFDIFIGNSRIVSRDWLNDSYFFRIPISISTTSALTGYQVKLLVNTSDLVAQGKMNPDCSDMLFGDSAGVTLDYYIEEGCDTANTTVWFKADLSAGDNLIYLYYGNPFATAADNPSAVFDLYDDFEDGIINDTIWDDFGPATETGGYANFARIPTGGWSGIRSKESFGTDYIAEYSIYNGGDWGDCSTAYNGFYSNASGLISISSYNCMPSSIQHIGFGQGWCGSHDMCSEQANGAAREGGTVGRSVAGTWDFVSVVRTAAGSDLYAKMGTLVHERSVSTYNPDAGMELFFGWNFRNTLWCQSHVTNPTMRVYWARVRKLAETEPVIWESGTEQAVSSSLFVTDQNGNYNVTVEGPAVPGIYQIKVNSSVEEGSESSTLTVQAAPVINAVWVTPDQPELNEQFMIYANASDLDDNIDSVQIIVTDPAAAVAVNEEMTLVDDVWASSAKTADQYGRWNYTVTVVDDNGYSDEHIGFFIVPTRPQILMDYPDWNTGDVDVLSKLNSTYTIFNNGTDTLVVTLRLPRFVSTDLELDTTEYIVTGDYIGNVYYTPSLKDGNFGTQTYIGDIGDSAWGCSIADYDNDGDYDFTIGNKECTQYLYTQDSPGSFIQTTIGSIAPCADYTMDMATADFNNDGNFDYVTSGNDINLHLFLGNGDGTFDRTAIPGPGGDYFRGKDAADFNGDGNMDFAMTNSQNGEMYIFFGYGNGSFWYEYKLNVGGGAYGLTAADFDLDGNIDLMGANSGGEFKFYRGDGAGGMVYVNQLWNSNRYTPMDAFDFNKDGLADIAYTYYDYEYLYFRPGNGDGTFGSAHSINYLGDRRMGICSPPENSYPMIRILPGESRDVMFIIDTQRVRIIDGPVIVSTNDINNVSFNFSLYANIQDVYGPVISDVTEQTEVVHSDDPVTITARVTDNHHVDSVYLFYSFDGGAEVELAMTRTSGDDQNGTYSAVISSQKAAGTVSYRVSAFDINGNSVDSGTLDYEVSTPPVINEVVYDPAYPNVLTDIIVNVNVTDDKSLTEVVLYYDDPVSHSLPMVLNGEVYEAAIPGFDNTTSVTFRITATDDDNFSNTTREFSFTADGEKPSFTKLENNPEYPKDDEDVKILLGVDDNIGVADIDLHYRYDGEDWVDYPMNDSSTILFVDDDGGKTSDTHMTDALDALGMKYDVHDVSSLGSPSAELLGEYDAVIWMCDNYWQNTLQEADRTALEGYLGNGGKVFIGGGMIGYDSYYYGWHTWLKTWLKGSYYTYATGSKTYVGNIGDPIGDGLSFQTHTGDYHTSLGYYYNSVMNEINGGVESVYLNGYNRPGIISYMGDYGLVYSTFPLADVNGASNREDILRRVLDFLEIGSAIIIPAANDTITVDYYATARDVSGNVVNSSIESYLADGIEPVIDDVTEILGTVNYQSPVDIIVEASDNQGLSDVMLHYTTDNATWYVIVMNKTASYLGTIPATGVTATVQYYVQVFDLAGNDVNSTVMSYEASSSPIIQDVIYAPTNPNGVDPVRVNATVTDDGTVVSVYLNYSIEGWNQIAMTLDGGSYTAIIPATATTEDVSYRIIATDDLGFTSISETYNYVSDSDEPVLEYTYIQPEYPNPADNVTVIAGITDNVGLDNATLFYRYGSDSWQETEMSMGLGVPYDYVVESPHPYTNYFDHTWVVERAGAEMVRVHFESIQTESCCDGVYVYDGDDNLIATYKGYYSDIFSPWADGDTIKIRLSTDVSIVHYGFKIDKAEYEGISAEIPGPGYDTGVSYYIVADDLSGNSLITGQEVYYIDGVDPVISSVTEVSEASINEDVLITAEVSDNLGIDSVTLFYSIDGSAYTDAIMTLDGDYHATIPATGTIANISYYVEAIDFSQNIVQSAVYEYHTTSRPAIHSIDVNDSYPGLVDVEISVNVTDEIGLASVILYYSFDNGTWKTVSIISGLATIEAPAVSSTLYYYVVAENTGGYTRTSDTMELYFDGEVPIIVTPDITPVDPYSYEDVTVAVSVTDDSGVDSVILYYSYDNLSWNSVAASWNAVRYEAIVPKSNSTADIQYYIEAFDVSGNIATTDIFSYLSADVDIEVINIIINGTLQAGETVTIHPVVKNTGDGPIRQSTVVGVEVDGTVLGFRTVPALSTGEEYTASISWSVTAGDHYIMARADNGDILTEIDEDNDYLINVTTTASDLTVEKIEVDTDACDGAEALINATVVNADVAANDGFYVNFYVDGNYLSTKYLAGLEGSADIAARWTVTPGEHEFKVVADASNQVAEGNEANNERTESFSFAYPNLFIDSINYPSDISDGETFTVNATIVNDGHCTERPSYIAYYMNGVVFAQDPVGAVYTETVEQIELVAAPGLMNLTAEADHYDSIDESEEADNRLDTKIDVAYPDLTVTSIEMSEIEPVDGQLVYINVTIDNLGANTMRDFDVEISYNQTLIGIVVIEGLDEEMHITLPWMVVGGVDAITAAVDPAEAVSEGTELNNEMSYTFSEIEMPDLTVTDLSWSPESGIDDGDMIEFSAVIVNNGGDTLRPFDVGFALNESNQTTYLGNVKVYGLVGAEAVNLSWVSTGGSYDAHILIDEGEEVSESNEDNNYYSEGTINVLVPNLIVDDVTFSALGDGMPVNVTITISNVGAGDTGRDFYVALDVDNNTMGIELVDGLAAGASTQVMVDAWQSTLGLHNLRARVDSGLLIPESEEDDNSLTVTADVPDNTAPYMVSINPMNSALVNSLGDMIINLSDGTGVGVDLDASQIYVERDGSAVGGSKSIVGDILYYTLDDTDDGNHTIEVEAHDLAGNVMTYNSWFELDQNAPEITVSGVADGAYYEVPVTPLIDIIDANLAATDVLLDGSVFVSGTRINSDGDYGLQVYAGDDAGNLAVEVLNFTVDLPPSAPTKLSIVDDLGDKVLSWKAPPEYDIKGYNIYMDGILVGYTSKKKFTHNGSGNYRVASVDVSGHESVKANVSSLGIDLAGFGSDDVLTRGFVDDIVINLTNTLDTLVDINQVKVELIDDLGNVRATNIHSTLTVAPEWYKLLESVFVIDEDFSSTVRIEATLADGNVVGEVFELETQDHGTVIAGETFRPVESYANQYAFEFTNFGSEELHIDPTDIVLDLRDINDTIIAAGHGVGSMVTAAPGETVFLQGEIYTPLSSETGIHYGTINLELTVPTEYFDTSSNAGPTFTQRIDAVMQYQTIPPMTLFYNPMIKGTRNNLTLVFVNQGTVDVEIDPSDVTIDIEASDGTVIAHGSSSGTSGTIRAGDDHPFSVEFDLPEEAPETVVIVARANTSSETAINMPFEIRIVDSLFNPPYDATAETDLESYLVGEVVHIEGDVFSTDDASVVPNSDVKVSVSSEGYIREYLVTADSAGHYEMEFLPLANEAGSYLVSATHPMVNSLTIDDTFEINGLVTLPSEIFVGMSKNSANPVKMAIQNLGLGEIVDVVIPIQSVGGVTITVSESGFDLAAKQKKSVELIVDAVIDADDEVMIPIVVETASGDFVNTQVRVQTFDAVPVIYMDSMSLETSMRMGDVLIKSVEIDNIGFDDLKDVEVVHHSIPWVSVISNTSLGDIDVNTPGSFDIMIAPPEGVEAGVYEDSIEVFSSNHETFVFEMRIILTANATGGLEFKVANELGDPVPGSDILIMDKATTTVKLRGTTDDDGMYSFGDVPIGNYLYFVDTPYGTRETGEVEVTGTDVLVEVSTLAEWLKIEYEVVPTTIEDVYEVRHNIIYDTKAPVPYIETTGLPDSLLMVPGAVYHGQVTLTNLNEVVSAYNGTPKFYADSELVHIEFLIDEIPELKAGESITIPYVVRLAEHHSPKSTACNRHYWHFTTEWTKKCVEWKVNGEWYHRYVYIPAGGHTVSLDVFCIEAYPDTALCIADLLGGEVSVILKAMKFGVIDLPGTFNSCFNVLKDCMWRANFYTGTVTSVKDMDCKNDFAGCVSGITGTDIPFFSCYNAAYKWGKCMFTDSCKPPAPEKPKPEKTPGSKPPGNEPGGAAGGGAKPGRQGSSSTGGLGGGGSYYFMGNGAGGGGLQAFLISMAPPAMPGRCHASPEKECIKAQVSIVQEATLERQAFDAKLSLTNLRDDYPLANLVVVMNITYDNGTLANDNFFVSLENTGASQIEPGEKVTFQWLMIPKPGAGGNDSERYSVDVDIYYTVKNVSFTAGTWPDDIIVFPMPKLTLDYFLPKVVYGDDLLTENISEPVVPFVFGVRVKNSGVGPAYNLAIDSAQPTIEQQSPDVDLGFKLLGTYVNGTDVKDSLAISFGNIMSGDCIAAGWQMESAVLGNFSAYTAEFSHSDALGGKETSLIENVTTHRLVKEFINDEPGKDDMFDFLVDIDDDQIPDLYYGSECDDGKVTVFDSDMNGEILNLTQSAGGLGYTAVPFTGDVVSIESRMGKMIDPMNYWVKEGMLHMVDYDADDWYNVTAIIPVAKPDLIVDDMALSIESPAVGENITVTADIVNIGNQSEFLSGVTVQLLVDDAVLDSVVIDVMDSISVSFNWTAVVGLSELKIIADTADIVDEDDENNNDAVIDIIVVDPSGNQVPYFDPALTNQTYDLCMNKNNVVIVNDISGSMSADYMELNYTRYYGYMLFEISSHELSKGGIVTHEFTLPGTFDYDDVGIRVVGTDCVKYSVMPAGSVYGNFISGDYHYDTDGGLHSADAPAGEWSVMLSGADCGGVVSFDLEVYISIIDSLKEANKAFIDESTGERVGLMSFTAAIGDTIDVSSNHTGYVDEIYSYSAEGSTCICCAINHAVDMLETVEGRKTIIVMSDGEAMEGCIEQGVTDDLNFNGVSNDFGDDAVQAACDAYDQGITVHSIGFGKRVDMTSLAQGASCTGGEFYYARDSDEMMTLFSNLADEVFVYPYSFDVNCTDPDGDNLTYFDYSADFDIDHKTGVFGMNVDVGEYDIPLECSDDEHAVYGNFYLDVFDSCES